MARQPRKTRPPKQQPGILGQLIRQMGSLGGGAIGSLVGMPMSGAAAGNSLGAALSKWLGSGDYTVSSNSLVTKASSGIPMMHKTGQSITIRHRELVTQVLGQTAFNVQGGYPINPGCSQTFPWLATIARSFEEYEFKGLVFHYIPTSGNTVAGTNPALGSVMLQSTYRASDGLPASKSEMMNEYYGCESVPSETFCHPVECDPKENPFNIKYVRSGNVPAGDSILLYDVGTTFLAASGMQSASPVVLGDLWVTYDVVLRKPVVHSNVTVSNFYSASFNSASLSSLFSGGILSSSGNLPATLTANNVLSLLPGSSGVFQITVSLINPYGNDLITSGGFANALQSGPSNATLVSPYGAVPSIYSAHCTATSAVSNLSTTFWISKPDANTTASMQIPLPTITGTFSTTFVTITLWA